MVGQPATWAVQLTGVSILKKVKLKRHTISGYIQSRQFREEEDNKRVR